MKDIHSACHQVDDRKRVGLKGRKGYRHFGRPWTYKKDATVPFITCNLLFAASPPLLLCIPLPPSLHQTQNDQLEGEENKKNHYETQTTRKGGKFNLKGKKDNKI